MLEKQESIDVPQDCNLTASNNSDSETNFRDPLEHTIDKQEILEVQNKNNHSPIDNIATEIILRGLPPELVIQKQAYFEVSQDGFYTEINDLADNKAFEGLTTENLMGKQENLYVTEQSGYVVISESAMELEKKRQKNDELNKEFNLPITSENSFMETASECLTPEFTRDKQENFVVQNESSHAEINDSALKTIRSDLAPELMIEQQEYFEVPQDPCPTVIIDSANETNIRDLTLELKILKQENLEEYKESNCASPDDSEIENMPTNVSSDLIIGEQEYSEVQEQSGDVVKELPLNKALFRDPSPEVKIIKPENPGLEKECNLVVNNCSDIVTTEIIMKKQDLEVQKKCNHVPTGGSDTEKVSFDQPMVFMEKETYFEVQMESKIKENNDLIVSDSSLDRPPELTVDIEENFETKKETYLCFTDDLVYESVLQDVPPDLMKEMKTNITFQGLCYHPEMIDDVVNETSALYLLPDLTSKTKENLTQQKEINGVAFDKPASEISIEFEFDEQENLQIKKDSNHPLIDYMPLGTSSLLIDRTKAEKSPELLKETEEQNGRNNELIHQLPRIGHEDISIHTLANCQTDTVGLKTTNESNDAFLNKDLTDHLHKCSVELEVDKQDSNTPQSAITCSTEPLKDHNTTVTNGVALETESKMLVLTDTTHSDDEINHTFAAQELSLKLFSNLNTPTSCVRENQKHKEDHCSNYATQIKQFLFSDMNTEDNEKDSFCFTPTIQTINSSEIEEMSERNLEHSLTPPSPEPGILSSVSLNKRQRSFVSDFSTVQLMRQRFDNAFSSKYTEIDGKQSFLSKDKQAKGSPSKCSAFEKLQFKNDEICCDINPTALTNMTDVKSVWANNVDSASSDSDQFNKESSFVTEKNQHLLFSTNLFTINKETREAVQYDNSRVTNPDEIDGLVQSGEFEMLNTNLKSVEKELSKVINNESEEIDNELMFEICGIDSINYKENPVATTSCTVQGLYECSKLELTEEHQLDIGSIEDEIMDCNIQREISEVDSLPNPDEINEENYFSNIHFCTKPKKLIRVDSCLFDTDFSDDEVCGIEKERLDDDLVKEVSLVDALLEEDKKLNLPVLESNQIPPELVCVVKPRLILVDSNIKNTSFINDEELDGELQKELDEIDNIVETCNENERIELSNSAMGFFSSNANYDFLEGIEDINNVPDTDLNNSKVATINCPCIEDQEHDMNNYEFFKSSSNYMYSENTVNRASQQNEYDSLEPSFDSLQSGLSGAGESFSDQPMLFNENNLSISTESDGSDFHTWSSNVEFGDPAESVVQEGMDFDSIISAPNLNEALKKLEAHIQDKGDEMQWLTVRTPSPSLQSLEKYFQDGVSCFDTDKFYVEVSGGLLPENTTFHSDSLTNMEKDNVNESCCGSIEESQTTSSENIQECSYLPGSKEAKQCELDNQATETDNWIISPYQYPRVLLVNTDQMSIIVEEDDQRKSEPPSPLQKYYKDTSLSSEQSIEENKTDSLPSKLDPLKLEKEFGRLSHTLEEIDHNINKSSIDNIKINEPLDDSVSIDYINKKECDIYQDNYILLNKACQDIGFNSFQESKNNKVINRSNNFQNFSNVYETETNIDDQAYCNTNHENSRRAETKLLLEGNIDTISEDTLNKFSVTERKTFWDKKLQQIQDQETNATPSSGPKSLTKIKSGTVLQLVSSFAEISSQHSPSCLPKALLDSPKKIEQRKSSEENDLKSKGNEKPNQNMLDSPSKEHVDCETSVKPVSQWKAYWDEIITEQQLNNQTETNQILKIPSIQIIDNGEFPDSATNKKLQCEDFNKNMNHSSESNGSCESKTIKETDSSKNSTTESEPKGSVLKGIQIFSGLSNLANNLNSDQTKQINSKERDSVVANDIVGKGNEVNSNVEERSSSPSLLVPVCRSRSFSTGDLGKQATAIDRAQSNQETKSVQDIVGSNEFRTRFEKAKLFFKQLESAEPVITKERDFKSMPRLDLVPSNRKTSIDSDSGADTKPQKRRDRYRNRRKKRKTSSKVQSAPTSDTETAKRVQSKDSFESFGGSVKSVKVSERFHVKYLFRDVSGKGLFRGIPNRAAVLASLRSVDDERALSPYQMDYIDPKSASLGNIPAGFQDEYPYLPTTPVHQFRPRSALEFNLIPRSQLLDEDF